MLIKAYHARHNVCPGHLIIQLDDVKWMQNYPHVDPSIINPAQVEYITFKGAFVYNHHDTDVFDLIKDKAICPKSIELLRGEEDLRRLP